MEAEWPRIQKGDGVTRKREKTEGKVLIESYVKLSGTTQLVHNQIMAVVFVFVAILRPSRQGGGR